MEGGKRQYLPAQESLYDPVSHHSEDKECYRHEATGKLNEVVRLIIEFRLEIRKRRDRDIPNF